MLQRNYPNIKKGSKLWHKKICNELELLREISKTLDTLTAIMEIRGFERDEQIKILLFLGFSNPEICKYTLIPMRTVERVKAKLREKATKSQKSGQKRSQVFD